MMRGFIAMVILFIRDARLAAMAVGALVVCAVSACRSAGHSGSPDTAKTDEWIRGNPVEALPRPPLGTEVDFRRVAWVTPAKVRLGRWLFFDKRLSGDGNVSCATCHQADRGLSDGSARSAGARGNVTKRKSQTLVNVVWSSASAYTWDGHEPTLEAQVAGAIANPVTMGSSHEEAVRKLSAIGGYRRMFHEAWGDDAIDIGRVAQAIAAYEATRISGNSRYDRYLAGDASALGAQAERGRELFFGKAECSGCHSGWDFTDAQFHNLGIGWRSPTGDASEGFTDVGRAKVTRRAADTGAFKTPTLRDVSLRAPYMHDGSIATLREAVEHYNRGGTPNPWLSPALHPLGLASNDVDAVVAFLEALRGEGYADSGPPSFPE